MQAEELLKSRNHQREAIFQSTVSAFPLNYIFNEQEGNSPLTTSPFNNAPNTGFPMIAGQAELANICEIKKLTTKHAKCSKNAQDFKMMDATDWYWSLSVEQQNLYDEIEHINPEFCDYEINICKKFLEELKEINITTAKDFSKLFSYDKENVDHLNAIQLKEEIYYFRSE